LDRVNADRVDNAAMTVKVIRETINKHLGCGWLAGSIFTLVPRIPLSRIPGFLVVKYCSTERTEGHEARMLGVT
jgi:hypothetical protein